MKKTLLAAALLAGFATAGVAQAETSVTLYGILDTGYGYQNYKLNDHGVDQKVTNSGLRSGTFNGNRFGLKGSEDLGDGLRAIFQLEAGFDIGNGQNNGGAALGYTTAKDSAGNTYDKTTSSSDYIFHRQAFVGLSSDSWGTLTMGRQYSAGVDANLAANGVNLGDMDKVFGGVGLGGNDRVDNSFKYVTPNFSGFKAIVLYGNPKTSVERGDLANSDRSNRASVGLTYANGPIGVGASYDRQSNGGNDAITNWNLNASYDFEVVKLSLAYGQDRHGKLGWAGSASGLSGIKLPSGSVGDISTHDDFKSNNYHVGLSAPLAGGTLYAGWNRSSSNLDDAVADGGWGDAAGNINTYQVNYTYPLSKRTMVYVYGSYGTNIGYVDGLKGKEAGLGLNHKF